VTVSFSRRTLSHGVG